MITKKLLRLDSEILRHIVGGQAEPASGTSFPTIVTRTATVNNCPTAVCPEASKKGDCNTVIGQCA